MSTDAPFFPPIGTLAIKADDNQVPSCDTDDSQDKVVQELESLCMSCHHQGTTRLMLTSIPYFRQVIVMSFRCNHCGASNNEIQSAGQIQVQGTRYTAKILTRADLDRQLVRSPTCQIALPHLALELPPTGRGQLTTVEGLLRNILSDLSADQPLRSVQDPKRYSAIAAILASLRASLGEAPEEDDDKPSLKTAEKNKNDGNDKDDPLDPPFTLKLDDPAGNSWIEFIGGMSDPKWSFSTYARTLQQNMLLGLVAPDSDSAPPPPPPPPPPATDSSLNSSLPDPSVPDDEIFVFPGNCSSCGLPIETKIKKVDIPYFKQVLIMSTNCEHCGYRDNEIKSGGAISEKGKRITLRVEDSEDLSRDILKSETAGLTIPEIDLVLQHGTLGGRFTTIEGILNQVYDELSTKAIAGDSVDGADRQLFTQFLERLEKVKNVEHPFTLVLDDPLANSYVQNLFAPDPDPNMVVEMYERTWEQNENLGLNDIKVEGYDGANVDGGAV